MSLNRREVMQGGLAAFVSALLPFRVEESPKPTHASERYDTDEPWKHPIIERETFVLPGAIMGICGQKSRILARHVVINLPTDRDYLKREPMHISIDAAVGPFDEMQKLMETFGDISTNANMVFAVTRSEGELEQTLLAAKHQVGDIPAPVDKHAHEVWVLERPIFTSVGMSVNTPASRIDAFGVNGCKDIQIPDNARMQITNNLQLQCMNEPRQYGKSLIDTFWPHAKTGYHLTGGNSMHGKKPSHREPTQQEQLDYNAQNNDPDAWSEAGVDVKDPSTYPEYKGGMKPPYDPEKDPYRR